MTYLNKSSEPAIYLCSAIFQALRKKTILLTIQFRRDMGYHSTLLLLYQLILFSRQPNLRYTATSVRRRMSFEIWVTILNRACDRLDNRSYKSIVHSRYVLRA